MQSGCAATQFLMESYLISTFRVTPLSHCLIHPLDQFVLSRALLHSPNSLSFWLPVAFLQFLIPYTAQGVTPFVSSLCIIFTMTLPPGVFMVYADSKAVSQRNYCVQKSHFQEADKNYWISKCSALISNLSWPKLSFSSLLLIFPRPQISDCTTLVSLISPHLTVRMPVSCYLLPYPLHTWYFIKSY